MSLGFDAQGRRIRRSVYADTKQEALAALTELRALPKPTMAASSRLMLTEFVPQWTAAMVAAGTPRENTRAYYESHIRTHILPTQLGGMMLAKIQPHHIESVLAGIRAPRSRVGAYEAMTSIYRLAMRRGLLRENPMHEIPKPKSPRPKVRIWLPDEARRVLGAARGTRFFGVYALGLGTGLRRGEIFALRPRDIDLERKSVRVERQLIEVEGKLWFDQPKTERSARTVQLPDFVVDALHDAIRETPDPDALLFSDSEGGPMRRSNFDRRVHRPMMARAGVPYRRLHEMRHSQVSMLLDAGESLKLISTRLGHSDERITLQTYGHLLPQADERAAKKIDAMLSPNSRSARKPVAAAADATGRMRRRARRSSR